METKAKRSSKAKTPDDTPVETSGNAENVEVVGETKKKANTVLIVEDNLVKYVFILSFVLTSIEPEY